MLSSITIVIVSTITVVITLILRRGRKGGCGTISCMRITLLRQWRGIITVIPTSEITPTVVVVLIPIITP